MSDDAILERATQALRRHTDQGWTLVRENVLLKALSAFRPSAPVRGRTATPAGTADYFVTADVLVAALRDVTSSVPGAVPLVITCSTDDDDRLSTVTLEILAAFDEPLLPLAAAVRRAVAAHLSTLLGELAPPAEAVDIDIAITDVVDQAGREQAARR